MYLVALRKTARLQTHKGANAVPVRAHAHEPDPDPVIFASHLVPREVGLVVIVHHEQIDIAVINITAPASERRSEYSIEDDPERLVDISNAYDEVLR